MSVRVPPDRPPVPSFDEARAIKGPLAAQLAHYGKDLAERSPETVRAYQNLVESLAANAVGENAPKSGDPLPPFSLTDDSGHLTTLDELLADGPLVVSFNRGTWCPYCWLELSALEDCYPAIREIGGSVVSITPEVATFSRRLKRRLGLSFPVLTDMDNCYALELGLATAIPDELRELFIRANIDIAAYQRSDNWFLPLPATLVVDANGIIRHAYVNADFRERIESSEIPGLLAGI